MSFQISTTKDLNDIYEISKIIKEDKKIYPEILDWYWNKVIPGVLTHSDKIIIAKQKNEILGFSIIKDNSIEKKIRALRIIPRLQNKGTKLSLNLIDKSIEELSEFRPHFTISENMINGIGRLFVNHYNANLSHIYHNLYSQNKYEYSFNESISPKIKTPYGN